ncbi:anti-sigma factor domain-containing protein [Desulfothermobacter acidiphilus]|uniref:anti-sigma factor domain-containing protein n=1 Tax=Desulfothermobacter acidiphilus TaxID=1938353 RepID=UPI003F89FB73
MKRQAKGLVLAVKNKQALVLTPEGEFLQVPAEGREVGEELIFSPTRRGWLYPALALVASLLVVLGGSLYYWCCPAPAAYLSLDINPSLELGISREGKVVSSHPYDKEAEQLLATVKLKDLPLEQALDLLLARAESAGYLGGNGEGVVLIAVLQSRPVLAPQEIASWAEAALAKDRKQVKLMILELPLSFQTESSQKGLSPGRYALLHGMASLPEGKISVAEARQLKLEQLEQKCGASLETLLQREGAQVLVKEVGKDKNLEVEKKGMERRESPPDKIRPAKPQESNERQKEKKEHGGRKTSSDDPALRHRPLQTFPGDNGDPDSGQPAGLFPGNKRHSQGTRSDGQEIRVNPCP